MDVDVNWEDLRTFFASANAGSFRRAARRLGVQNSTVLRRIERLESVIGAPLFARLPNGVRLTSAGLRLAVNARRFEDSARHLRQAFAKAETERRGLVRVDASEAIGADWLTPHLIWLERAYPMLIIELRLSGAARAEAETADIVVGHRAPSDDGESAAAGARRIGALHLNPFASRGYLETYGPPTSKADLLRHRIVEHAGCDAAIWPRFIGGDDETLEGVVALRADTLAAARRAIELGAGVGALPSFAPAAGARVEPVDIGVNARLDVWMRARSERPEARAVAEWIAQAFDPKAFPWFRDAFAHPHAAEAEARAVAAAAIGEGPSTEAAALRPTLDALRPL